MNPRAFIFLTANIVDSDLKSIMSSDMNCGSGGGATTYPQLRIASVFIVLIGSMSGALFPVLAKRTSLFHVPKGVFE